MLRTVATIHGPGADP